MSNASTGNLQKYQIEALLVFAATLIALILFRMYPEADLYVSSMFFAEIPCEPGGTVEFCGWFPLQYNETLKRLRQISLSMPFMIITICVGYLLYQLLWQRNTTGAALQKSSLVIWTLLVATVGLVNLLLKEFWGRPRPFQIEGLGGDQPFVLPGSFSDYCASNCSFVSGEASSAAWLLTLLVFVPRKFRVATGLAIGIYVLFFSGLRVAFGKHFVSDVTISILITLSVFFALRVLFSTVHFQKYFENVARWSNQRAFDNRTS